MKFERTVTYDANKNRTNIVYAASDGWMFGTIARGDVRDDDGFLDRCLLRANSEWDEHMRKRAEE